MATVLLAGAFGQCNPGDEALLGAFVDELAEHRVIATSADPGSTRSQHGCDAVSSADVAAVATAMRRADALVIGGGTVFKTLHPSTGRSAHGLLRNADLLTLGARATAKPVLMVGVGAAPLVDARARRLARRLVRRADLLVLRDPVSARLLADAGAPAPFRVGADPTWGSLGNMPFVAPAPEDVVVVTVSRFAGSPDLAARLGPALRAAVDAGLRVCVQPWQVGEGGADDLALTHALATEVQGPVELVDPPADLQEAKRRAASARLVIGMRFHSLVASAAAGTRFLAIDHEPKLGALATQFGQRAVDPRAPAAEFSVAVTDALAGPPPATEVAREQVALAAEGFRLLHLILARGESPDTGELIGLPFEPPFSERSA
ncbi:MAG TPA: polysaccharide pyruvyl transferase family protein [Acidimicrobiia bacterium]